jgi:hypothetical protein
MCEMFGVTTIIESGVAGGRSTEIWARYFDSPVISVDDCSMYGQERILKTQERLHKFQHVRFIIGRSENTIPQLLREQGAIRTGVFIDGPKGADAVALAKDCFNSSPHLIFVGIHDMCPEFYDHIMDAWDLTICYTDYSEFREKFAHLDAEDRKWQFGDGRTLGDRFPAGFVVGFAIRNSDLPSK